GTQEEIDQPATETKQEIALVRLKADSPCRSTDLADVSDKKGSVATRPPTTGAVEATAITGAVDILISLDSSYGQKQTAWRQVIEAGKLDDVIAALEQRRAAEPLVADYAAGLGHGYLKK